MIVPLLQFLLEHWLSVLGVTFISFLLSNRYHNGLNKYPGPFLASITNWWRFWVVYKKRPELEHIRLHEQHGDVVRLGPNNLSFSNPKALKTIYGLNKGFTKVRLTSLIILTCVITIHSQIFTLYNKQLQEAIGCLLFSAQHQNRFMPSFVGV